MWVTPPPMIDPMMPSTIVQKIRYVHGHYRFRDNPRDQPDKNVPDQVKHAVSPGVCLRNVVEYNPGFGNQAVFPKPSGIATFSGSKPTL
jgi:hypothetical protein